MYEVVSHTPKRKASGSNPLRNTGYSRKPLGGSGFLFAKFQVKYRKSSVVSTYLIIASTIYCVSQCYSHISRLICSTVDNTSEKEKSEAYVFSLI